MSDLLPPTIMRNQGIPLVAKMILWYLANQAPDDGEAAFATPAMLRDVTSGASDSTISRHIGWLLANGYIREGDQDRIKVEWRPLPRHRRPIVYDLATDEETRLAWMAAYDPDAGRRGAAARIGRSGGLASARGRAEQPVEDGLGVKTTPNGVADCNPSLGLQNGPSRVAKCDPFIRTKDSLTKDLKDGGGEPPTPVPDDGAQSGPVSAPSPVAVTRDPAVNAVIAEACAVRPAWSLLDVTRAVTQATTQGHQLDLVREVLLVLAADPTTGWPGRLMHVLPGWAGSGSPPRGRHVPAESARPAEIPLPEAFAVTGPMRTWAADKCPGVDADQQTRLFTAYYRSTGARRVSWRDAWEGWMLRVKPDRQAATPAQPRRGNQPTPDERAAAHRDAERYEAGEISLKEYLLGGTRRQPETLPSLFVPGEVVS